MATNAGMSNPLGSPREFGSPRTPRSMRMNNVFEVGKTAPSRENQLITFDENPSLLNTLAPVTSPQTQASLWNPLHEYTQDDLEADYFEHAVGGVANTIKLAGFGRIKKRSNKAEADFYKDLTLTHPEMAPTWHGVHLSEGNAWTPYVILQDLTAGFSKPQVLDVQIGPEHVGSEEAGSAPRVGLRLNGMQRLEANGRTERKSKKDGNSVTSNDWGHVIESFLTDATATRRGDVARCMIEFIDKLTVWVEAQKGLRLLGSSVLMVYEGDTTVGTPQAPVCKIMDFEHVTQGSGADADSKYLAAVQNLRWMLERFASFDQLELFQKEQTVVLNELAQAEAQLKINSAHAAKMAQVAMSLAPKPTDPYANRLLYNDIRHEELSAAVTAEQDNALAALLQAVLLKHGINAGQDAFVEILKWGVTPLITDKTACKQLLHKFAYDESNELLDDLLKWKETESAVLRPMSALVDCKLSAASELPRFQDLLLPGKNVDLRR